jgi:acetylornithine deacetylase/succinyl-diaminopimelate desuccinylase-like protein
MDSPIIEQTTRDKIHVWLENNRQAVLDYTLRLVRIESQQPEGDVRKMADEVAALAAEIPGAEIERYVSEEPVHNLVIRLRGNRPGKRLIFNGHMDTFPAGDLAGWARDPKGEVDGGSPHILRFGEKGMIWATVTAKGKSTHAAHVHRGESAIEKLTLVMENFKSLRQFPVDTAGDNVVPLIDHWSEKSESLSGAGETHVLKNVTITFGTMNGGRLHKSRPR